MRKVSTLVGLTLFALASTARAQEAAPAAATAAPPAGDAAATPTPATAAAASPPSAGAAATAAAAQPAASRRKIQVGLSFLPMAAGSFTSSLATPPESDASFAYGAGLSAGYMVLPGLILGIAPQAIFNVKGKEYPRAAKEYDLMARVAYAYEVADKTAVYAEVLPGYSLIRPSDGDDSKGLVVGFGAGAVMDVTDRLYANLGVGYQIGFQKQPLGDAKSKYLRVAMGGGVKF